jgi:hypothetical protein
VDLMLAKRDLASALRQVLQGFKANSREMADLTAARTTLTIVVTGRSEECDAEIGVSGTASIPISTLAGLKRILSTYSDDQIRLRVSEGKLRFQNTNITDPAIAIRRIAKRIIDIPADAHPSDLLSLPHLFTAEEIEESSLMSKVLDAQKTFANDLDSAAAILMKYGIARHELRYLADAKIERHSEGLKGVLFALEE